ncbi:hypothetical protein [Hydrogenophaga intermedia]|uniref:hypothetical protein n=1 Tax=Hydrogenophaga intermedia TaxID=65786 RepID=UPI00204492DD|nr:hypothetical protein [Hydrogenophaga intermedia]MCM3562796.1 hypothetical protein [Hydrogenophaga intermedia]
MDLLVSNFELSEESTAQMLWVVGGTGFAHVESLLDDVVKKRIRRPVTFMWTGRNRDRPLQRHVRARTRPPDRGRRYVPHCERRVGGPQALPPTKSRSGRRFP